MISEDKVNCKVHTQRIKCVVWDLDNTLWNGVILEEKNITLRHGIKEIIEQLDKRGILQSIASKNEQELVMDKLKEFEIEQYFLYPQISWNAKSNSIKEIAKNLNIGMNTIAFIDDQSYELEEVKFNHPQVLCINAERVSSILDMDAFIPRFITVDSKNRRTMYINDIQRKKSEENFDGPQLDFVKSLDMVLHLDYAKPDDLQRVEELTIRTNQLNATGTVYSYEELLEYCQLDSYMLLTASLQDKFGDYGKIGVTLIEIHDDVWILKMHLMSCRVMSRGIGTVILNHILYLAKKKGVRLLAEFIPNDRNRIMLLTYKMLHFVEIDHRDNTVILENNLDNISKPVDYITFFNNGIL